MQGGLDAKVNEGGMSWFFFRFFLMYFVPFIVMVSENHSWFRIISFKWNLARMKSQIAISALSHYYSIFYIPAISEDHLSVNSSEYLQRVSKDNHNRTIFGHASRIL